MYSGCVRPRGDRLEATHTIHDHATDMQGQVRRDSVDGGVTWSNAASLLAEGRDQRDPFVFEPTAAPRRMLLARPCGWRPTAGDPPSHVDVLEEGPDGWRIIGEIGPFSPPGVVWEMPVVASYADGDLPFVSTIDRRDVRSLSHVRAWHGAVTENGFTRARHWPEDGARVDLGPDFYAMIPASAPTSRYVAWLGSWDTARRMPWPGFHGGPISLPRRIGVRQVAREWRLVHRPARGLAAHFSNICGPRALHSGLGVATLDGEYAFRLTIASCAGSVVIFGDPQTATLSVSRQGADWLEWRQDHQNVVSSTNLRRLALFLDGPAIELFLMPDDQAVSIVLPKVEGEVFDITLEQHGSRAAFTFARLPDAPSTIS